MTDLS